MNMKKKISVLLLAIMCTFSACFHEYSTEESSIISEPLPVVHGIYEWISPDGVHYWIMSATYQYGIAPRYDSNGELIIDQKQE